MGPELRDVPLMDSPLSLHFPALDSKRQEWIDTGYQAVDKNTRPGEGVRRERFVVGNTNTDSTDRDFSARRRRREVRRQVMGLIFLSFVTASTVVFNQFLLIQKP